MNDQELEKHYHPENFEPGMTASGSMEEIMIGQLKQPKKPYKRPIGKTLSGYVSENTRSYLINEKGNALPFTLEGYGSCTPAGILDQWLNTLTKKKWVHWYKEVKNSKEKIV